MAPAFVGAACFQSEETPAYKCHLVFNEAYVCAIGHKCFGSFLGDSWPPLPDRLLSAHRMIV